MQPSSDNDRELDQPTETSKTRKFAGLQIRQPSEISQYQGVCLTLCGKGGVGKTTLAGTLTHSEIARRCLFVDLEGGAHVLDDDPHRDVISVKSWSELNIVMQHLVRNPGEYHSAVFDNMSEALELCKHHHNFYVDQSKQLGLWNQITNDMVQFFRQGRDLSRNTRFVMVYVMWDTMDAEDETGAKFKHREVALNPKLAEKFMGIMDLVAWLEQGAKPKPYPPVLHFDVDPLYPTKKRINPKQQALLKIPDIIRSPDLGEIIDTILGGKTWTPPSDAPKTDLRSMLQANRSSTTTNSQ